MTTNPALFGLVHTVIAQAGPTPTGARPMRLELMGVPETPSASLGQPDTANALLGTPTWLVAAALAGVLILAMLWSRSRRTAQRRHPEDASFAALARSARVPRAARVTISKAARDARVAPVSALVCPSVFDRLAPALGDDQQTCRLRRRLFGDA